MRRLSLLRQRQAELEHKRQELPQVAAAQPPPVTLDVGQFAAQYVMGLIMGGTGINFQAGPGTMPDGRAFLRLQLSVGPVVIPLNIDEPVKAQQIVDGIQAAVDTAWPDVVAPAAPHGDEPVKPELQALMDEAAARVAPRRPEPPRPALILPS